jgi:hypothetical protein
MRADLLKHVFKVYWESPNKFTAGLLKLPTLDPKYVQKIIRAPVTVETRYFVQSQNATPREAELRGKTLHLTR